MKTAAAVLSGGQSLISARRGISFIPLAKIGSRPVSSSLSPNPVLTVSDPAILHHDVPADAWRCGSSLLLLLVSSLLAQSSVRAGGSFLRESFGFDQILKPSAADISSHTVILSQISGESFSVFFNIRLGPFLAHCGFNRSIALMYFRKTQNKLIENSLIKKKKIFLYLKKSFEINTILKILIIEAHDLIIVRDPVRELTIKARLTY